MVLTLGKRPMLTQVNASSVLHSVLEPSLSLWGSASVYDCELLMEPRSESSCYFKLMFSEES